MHLESLTGACLFLLPAGVYVQSTGQIFDCRLIQAPWPYYTVKIGRQYMPLSVFWSWVMPGAPCPDTQYKLSGCRLKVLDDDMPKPTLAPYTCYSMGVGPSKPDTLNLGVVV